VKVNVSGLDFDDRTELASTAVLQARRFLRHDTNFETVLTELDNAQTLLEDLPGKETELALINALFLYTYTLIYTRNVQLSQELPIPSLDEVKQKLQTMVTDDERNQSSPITMDNLRELVRKPNEALNTRLILQTIYQNLELAEIEAPYQQLMTQLQGARSNEDLVVILKNLRLFILNNMRNADNTNSHILQLAHGRQKIQFMISQQFARAEEHIKDPATPFDTCAPFYQQYVTFYGDVFALLTEESDLPSAELREAFRQLTKGFSIRVNAALTQELDAMVMPDDETQLLAFGKKLDALQPVVPNQVGTDYNPYAELMQVKLQYLHKLADFAIAGINPHISSEVTTDEDVKRYDLRNQDALKTFDQLISLSESYSTDGLCCLALNKKAIFQNKFARLCVSTLKGNALFNFLRQDKDIALAKIKSIVGDAWLENSQTTDDPKKLGQILPSLYTVSMSYYTMATIHGAGANPSYCSVKAHEAASQFLNLINKCPNLAPVYSELTAQMNQLRSELDDSPAVKESRLNKQFDSALKEKNYEQVIQLGNQLLAIYQEKMNDEMELKRVADIYCDVAQAHLSLEHLDLNTRRLEAIKVLRRAVNYGTTLNKKACVQLKQLLDAELVEHANDRQTASITRELAVLRSKLTDSLRVSIPSGAPVPALNTPVNVSPSPLRSSPDPLTGIVPSYVILDELFARIAANDNTPSKPLHFFKANFGTEPICRARLMDFILSKTDDELKKFDAETLFDVGLGLSEKYYVVPANYSRELVLERLFKIAALDPNFKELASYYLGKFYSSYSNKHADAVQCYETAVTCTTPLIAAKARLALSAYYKDLCNYEKALHHLRAIFSARCNSPTDLPAFQKLQMTANTSAKKIQDLIEIKHSIPGTPAEPLRQSLPVEKKRPIVFFDIDNTIFYTAGDDDRFLCDANNNYKPASLTLKDFKKFYIGGVNAWREIFTTLNEMGVDIGICTAKPDSGRENCPLFRELITTFNDVFGNNPNIVFTNGGDKYNPLLQHCRGNPFKVLKRKYCILVDDQDGNKNQVEAAGFPFVSVKGLAESKDSADFAKFKTALFATVAAAVEQFNSQTTVNAVGSEDNSDVEDGEIPTVDAPAEATATTNSSAAVSSTSFAVPTMFSGRKKRAFNAETPAAATTSANPADAAELVQAQKKAARAPDRLEQMISAMTK